MKDEKQEQAYWLLVAFESKLPKRAISAIISNWCYQRSGTLQEFFSLMEQQWSDIYQFDESHITRLKNAREKIEDQVALVNLLAQKGFHILTIFDENYPRALKSTLSLNEIPPVLFYTGNLEMLELISVAIIGSRSATDESLEFTRLAAQYLFYWPIENNQEERSSIENVISPLLEAEMLNQGQQYIPSLSVQISRLLEKQRAYL